MVNSFCSSTGVVCSTFEWSQTLATHATVSQAHFERFCLNILSLTLSSLLHSWEHSPFLGWSPVPPSGPDISALHEKGWRDPPIKYEKCRWRTWGSLVLAGVRVLIARFDVCHGELERDSRSRERAAQPGMSPKHSASSWTVVSSFFQISGLSWNCQILEIKPWESKILLWFQLFWREPDAISKSSVSFPKNKDNPWLKNLIVLSLNVLQQ